MIGLPSPSLWGPLAMSIWHGRETPGQWVPAASPRRLLILPIVETVGHVLGQLGHVWISLCWVVTSQPCTPLSHLCDLPAAPRSRATALAGRRPSPHTQSPSWAWAHPATEHVLLEQGRGSEARPLSVPEAARRSCRPTCRLCSGTGSVLQTLFSLGH